tara:strand:+ start:12264 stop:12386 length:123 start_codon:yes stop_codon:yes gene_type:complete
MKKIMGVLVDFVDILFKIKSPSASNFIPHKKHKKDTQSKY